MKKKFLSISSILVILLIAVGCGGSGATNSSDSTKQQSNLTVEFKSTKSTDKSYQKVSKDDVAKVFISIAKKGTAYLDNTPMVKDSVTHKWGIGVNLDNSLAPYDVLVIAKDESNQVIFRSKAGSTIEDLSEQVVLVVEEVKSDIGSTSLPSVKSITHKNNGNTIDIHFILNNATRYSLSSSTGGTFNPSFGLFFGTTSTEDTVVDTVYTKSTNETDVFLSIKLFNTNGDSISIPFNIKEGSNTLTVNFSPSVKIYVEEQLLPKNTYKITATVTDDDSTSWSYVWSRIRGAKALATEGGNPNELEIEGLTTDEHYPMCLALTVTDDEGASSSIHYCIKNADNGYVGLKKTGQTKSYDQAGDEVTDGSVKDDGFYQKGLTPQYTRDVTAQTVTDHVTGLVWQDDVDAKSVTKNWNDAKDYCDTKGNGWHLPTIQELNSIMEYSNERYINSAFINTYSFYYWSSTSNVRYYNSHAWMVSFDYGDQYYNIKANSFYVRCVRAGQ